MHDSIPTPDDQYAVLTVRSVTEGCDVEGKPIPGKDITDGFLMLYDVQAKQLLTRQSSVCQACYRTMALGDKNAVLCGIDATWKK